MPNKNNNQEDWIPRPDPTKLTTDQLNREISALEKIITTRLDGMDRAIVIFNENLTRVPTDTDKQVQGLKTLLEQRLGAMDKAQELLHMHRDEQIHSSQTLVEEKITGVQTQLKERDDHVKQAAIDAKIGLDAALQAAEKAGNKQTETFTTSINKSENSTNNALAQINTTIATQSETFNSKLNAQKDLISALETRVARAETVALNIVTTGTENKTSNHNSNAIIVAIAAVIISGIGMLATVTAVIYNVSHH